MYTTRDILETDFDHAQDQIVITTKDDVEHRIDASFLHEHFYGEDFTPYKFNECEHSYDDEAGTVHNHVHYSGFCDDFLFDNKKECIEFLNAYLKQEELCEK